MAWCMAPTLPAKGAAAPLVCSLEGSHCIACMHTTVCKSGCVCVVVQVCGLEVELGDAEREKDLATHTLTDRTAQLQLLTTRTEVVYTIQRFVGFCAIYIRD